MRDDIGQRTRSAHRPMPGALFGLTSQATRPANRDGAFATVRAIQARSAALAPTRSIVSSVVGLVLVCILTAMMLLPYADYGTAKSFQDCTLGANTAIAAADCNARFYDDLESMLGGFLSFGQHAGG